MLRADVLSTECGRLNQGWGWTMRRLRGLGPCALLLAAAGCVPATQPAFDGDPLFGGQPRLPRNGAATSPTTATVTPAQLSPASASASPAALAAAVPADASGLRIGPAPTALTSAPHDNNGWQQPSGSAGATLQPPQPLVGPPPLPVNGVAPPTVGGPIAVPAGAPPLPVVPAGRVDSDSFGQLEDELNRRGVLWQKLEGPDDQGVWSFSCARPAARRSQLRPPRRGQRRWRSRPGGHARRPRPHRPRRAVTSGAAPPPETEVPAPAAINRRADPLFA